MSSIICGETHSKYITYIREKIACGSANFILQLSDLPIIELPSDIFIGCRNICNVYITNAQLIALPDRLFANMPLLQRINFDDNKLQVLPNGLFANCRMLQHVRLNNNRLKTLPDGLFEDCPNLQSLYLHQNLLEILPNRLFANNTKLTSINLAMNHSLNTLPECILLQLNYICSKISKHNPYNPFIMCINPNPQLYMCIMPYINNLELFRELSKIRGDKFINKRLLCIIERHRRNIDDAFSVGWNARKYIIIAKTF